LAQGYGRRQLKAEQEEDNQRAVGRQAIVEQQLQGRDHRTAQGDTEDFQYLMKQYVAAQRSDRINGGQNEREAQVEAN